MPLRKDPLPQTSAILTFMRSPAGDLHDLKDGMVAVAGVNYDISSTARIGARFAPYSIREASIASSAHLEGDEFVDLNTMQVIHYIGGKIIDLGDLQVSPVNWEKTESNLKRQMYEICRRRATPVIIGGDHLITYPLVLGFQDAIREQGGRRVGYIQFSSQIDLGDEDPLWGTTWRGCTAKRILDSGYVAPHNMVWVGAHGYTPQTQIDLAHELNLSVFTLADVRREGAATIAEKAIELAGRDCDAIYVSVDLNSVNGAYAPGVDAPSFRGMTGVELLKAVKVISRSKAGALDVVGCNPIVEYGTRGKTAEQLGVSLILQYIEPKITRAI
jgi:agmatinase